MFKSPIVKMVLVLLPTLLLPKVHINGCGYYFLLDEYRIALFNPKLSDDPALRSFDLFFDVPFVYQTVDPELKDYQRNCQEWAQYLGDGVETRDVLKVLYRTPPDDFLVALEDQALATLFPGNTFIQQLLQPEHQEALRYLSLAMRAEFAHFSSDDPWGLDESQYDFFQKITPVIKTAREKIAQLKDPFLIQRYAYQLVVQYRYTGDQEECLRYCDEYFDLEQPQSILVAWANFYKGELLQEKGDAVQGNYILSRVFELCESKKNRILQLLDNPAMNEALNQAKTDHERAVIHAMLCFKNPGRALPDLEKAAQYDPGLRYLPQLLTREINKIENWLLTPQVTYFSASYTSEEEGDEVDYDSPEKNMMSENYGVLASDIPYLKKNQTKDRAYLQQVRGMLQQTLQQPRFQARDFAHLALAHLYYLDQSPRQASEQLEKITDSRNPYIQLQKNIIQLLIIPDQLDIRLPQVQDEIVRAFRRVQAQAHLFPAKLRIYPKLIMYYSRLYQKKGDVVTAGLLYNRAQVIPTNTYMSASNYYGSIRYFDRYATLADLDALIALAKAPQKPPFAQFLTDTLNRFERGWSIYNDQPEDENHLDDSLYPVLPKLEQLYDLKGTLAFRQNRLEEALAAFEQLPPTYWRDHYEFSNYLKRDPIAAGKTFPWQGEPWPTFSKAELVKRMIALQKEAAQPGPKQAEACYLLGNAYYNTSFWGNAWMMFSYGQSIFEYIDDNPAWASHGNFMFSPNSRTYFDVYYKMSRALEYYQKALRCQPSEELAAQTTLMLGTCDRYRWLVDEKKTLDPGYYEEEEEDKKPYISPIFYTFRDRFGHTTTYRESLNACPELNDYFKE